MFPSIRNRPEFEDLLDKYPKELLAFFGGAGDLDVTSPVGYLRVELMSFMAPVLALVLAIGTGAGALAGEEESGRLELVLAQPVSRRRVVAEAALVVLHAVGFMTVVLWLALWAGTVATGMHVAVARLLAGALAVGVLALVYGLVALALGAATGRRAFAIAVATALAVAAYLVSSLSDLIAGLRPLRPLSPFRETLGLDPLATGFHPVATVALLALCVALVAVGGAGIERRDLH
jgi:ABC-2 type transport system permease protein